MGYECMRAAITPQLCLLSPSPLVISVRGHFDSRAGSARPPPYRAFPPPHPWPFPAVAPHKRSARVEERLRADFFGPAAAGYSGERRATARYGWSSPVRNLPFGVGSVGRAGDPPARLRPVGDVPHPPPTFRPSPSGMGGGGGRARAARIAAEGLRELGALILADPLLSFLTPLTLLLVRVCVCRWRFLLVEM